MGRRTEAHSLYALRHIPTNQLLTFSYTSNGDAEFCSSCYCELDVSYSEKDAKATPVPVMTRNVYDDPTWVVTSKDDAERVRYSSGKWYGAGYFNPMHRFKSEELEVVEYKLTAVKIS